MAIPDKTKNVHLRLVISAAQLVPGITWREAKPQSERASRGLAAAKAVRTATRAQLVPGMTRGGAKPQSERASRGLAAAKAVRTATKLSHRVTERYDAGY